MGVGRAGKTLGYRFFKVKTVRVGLQETNNFFLGLRWLT